MKLPSFQIVLGTDNIPVGVMRPDTDPFTESDVERLERHGARVIEYVPRPRWIPVTERLPGVGNTVLGFSGDGFMVLAAWNDSRWFDPSMDDGYGMYLGKITHWQPLPEPPEEP